MSRTPPVYSALEIEPHMSDGRLSLSLEGRANPFGEPNFEEAASIPDFTVSFIGEARRLIRQGLRPERPDLPGLLEEAARKAMAQEGGPPARP